MRITTTIPGMTIGQNYKNASLLVAYLSALVIILIGSVPLAIMYKPRNGC